MGRKTTRRRSERRGAGEEEAEEKQTKEREMMRILLGEADADGELDVVLWWDGGWGKSEG